MKIVAKITFFRMDKGRFFIKLVCKFVFIFVVIEFIYKRGSFKFYIHKQTVLVKMRKNKGMCKKVH